MSVPVLVLVLLTVDIGETMVIFRSVSMWVRKSVSNTNLTFL